MAIQGTTAATNRKLELLIGLRRVGLELRLLHELLRLFVVKGLGLGLVLKRLGLKPVVERLRLRRELRRVVDVLNGLFLNELRLGLGDELSELLDVDLRSRLACRLGLRLGGDQRMLVDMRGRMIFRVRGNLSFDMRGRFDRGDMAGRIVVIERRLDGVIHMRFGVALMAMREIGMVVGEFVLTFVQQTIGGAMVLGGFFVVHRRHGVMMSGVVGVMHGRVSIGAAIAPMPS